MLVHGPEQLASIQDGQWLKDIAGTSVFNVDATAESSRTEAQEPERHLYVYEKNTKTGSTSWYVFHRVLNAIM